MPPEARPSPAAQKEMRAFVSSMANFGFRSWVDSHGTMPDNVLPRVATFDFSQLGAYDPGPPPPGPKGQIMISWMENGVRKQTPLYSDDEGESDNDDDGAGTTNPEDPLGRVGVQVEYEVRKGRVAALLAVPAAWFLHSYWEFGRSAFKGCGPFERFFYLLLLAWLAVEAAATELLGKTSPTGRARDVVLARGRRINEWMLGVPPRPERTPYDEPVDRFRELPDEKPGMVYRKMGDGFTLSF
ncbi:hypothetical protein A1Q2_04475 [Trichosporon asahii var. asahii CBS 8904]|uniref:Uncharacterized protein n=1 Tax=Trichosporon asahii var. asahii (strain CBS 8904) TaxID=1220162 RepID=K1VB35_TRIAC|nr:hypothetical protein A1Q2_04475 [Trichosporon asahii var. asahii CBS 8904]